MVAPTNGVPAMQARFSRSIQIRNPGAKAHGKAAPGIIGTLGSRHFFAFSFRGFNVGAFAAPGLKGWNAARTL